MSTSLQNKYFPSLVFFIAIALMFLDIGILLGALNAFRLSVGEFILVGVNILDPNLILLTHWTNTLLGGLSLIMLGQIFFFFSYVNEEKFKLQWTMPIFLLSWLIGTASNYLASWFDFNFWHPISYFFFIAGVSLFLVVLLISIFTSLSKIKTKDNLPLLHLVTAIFWMWIALFYFEDTSQNALGSIFLNTYIFGFFTFVLYGSLFFLLPRLFDQKKPSSFTVILHYALLLIGQTFLFIDQYFARQGLALPELFDLFLPVLGTVLYAGAFFIFLLWLADFIFRTGITPSLAGLLISSLMMAFFVIDTFMSVVFPQWVEVNHVHFIFLGALLLTIISIGTKLITTQYSKAQEDEIKTWDFNEFLQASKFRLIVIILSISSIGMILLAFTVQNYFVAGIFGLSLFVSIILVDIELVQRFRKN